MPIVFYILILFLAIQLLYYLLFFGRFLFFPSNPRFIATDQPAVSVLICARNEASNLRKNLPKVLMQSYPKFEVLVVDDASEDESLEVLAEFQQKYPHFKLLKLPEKKGLGKKTALQEGIKQAKYDWLLLTDADGQPASEHWIAKMMAVRQPETEIVLGYGPYLTHTEWINKWIRFETHYVALQYLSAALWGIPYMGVGRNLLYHKALYARFAHTFQKHQHLASGDDDLFISQAANAKNTKFCISPESFVYSEPKRSFRALYRQKVRHYSTSVHYSWQHKILLAGLSFSHLAFWVSMLFAVFFLHPLPLVLILLIRFLSVLLIWTKTLRIFKDRKLLLYVLLLDMISPIYYIIFAPSLFFRKSSHWT